MKTQEEWRRASAHEAVSAVEAERPVERCLERAAVGHASERAARRAHAVADEPARALAADAVQLAHCKTSQTTPCKSNVATRYRNTVNRGAEPDDARRT